jgi:hypothetical protein
MTTYFVDSQATGENDGSSWYDAFTTLNDACGAATDGDEIWCKWCVLNLASTPTIQDGVSVYGGFPRYLRQTSGDKQNRPYKTVIDGGDSYRGVIMRTGSLLDGFEIRNCTNDYGAGIYVYNPGV